MATYRENLESRRLQVSAELADMSVSQTAGAKPSVKMADGGTHIDHVQYRLSLLKELEGIQKLIDEYDQSGGGSDGSVAGLEVVTYADP